MDMCWCDFIEGDNYCEWSESLHLFSIWHNELKGDYIRSINIKLRLHIEWKFGTQTSLFLNI